MTLAFKALAKTFNHRYLSPRGRIEPSGFFSVTNAPQKKRDRPSVRLNHDETKLLYLSGANIPHPDSKRDIVPCVSPLLGAYGPAFGEPLAFGSSNPVISRNRARRGSTGITGPQRRRLFWALECLESKSPRRTLSFLTLTVPTVTPEQCKLVQDAWPQIVHRFIEALKRELNRKSLSNVVFGCTEIQSARLERTGLAVPHLHLCFRGRQRNRGSWAIRPEWFRETFCRVLENCTGIEFNYRAAVENVQCVKKSVAGYLGKYLTKGFAHLPEEKRRDIWHPHDWVILGRNCRTKYLQLTRSGESIGELLRELLSHPRELWAKWLAPIEISTPTGIMRLGWYGYSDDWRVTVAPECLG